MWLYVALEARLIHVRLSCFVYYPVIKANSSNPLHPSPFPHAGVTEQIGAHLLAFSYWVLQITTDKKKLDMRFKEE